MPNVNGTNSAAQRSAAKTANALKTHALMLTVATISTEYPGMACVSTRKRPLKNAGPLAAVTAILNVAPVTAKEAMANGR